MKAARSSCLSDRASGRVAALLAVLLFTQGCRENIMHGLSEVEANRFLSSLHAASIVAEKVPEPEGTWSVAVDSSKALQALASLKRQRILRDTGALPARDKGPLLSTREERHFSLERSLSQELEATLASIDGVLQSRVHLNVPPADPLFSQQAGAEARGTASVLVIAASELRSTRDEIAALISGASGVPADRISVLINLDPDATAATRFLPGAEVGAEGRISDTLTPQLSYVISLVLLAAGLTGLYFSFRRPRVKAAARAGYEAERRS